MTTIATSPTLIAALAVSLEGGGAVHNGRRRLGTHVIVVVDQVRIEAERVLRLPTPRVATRVVHVELRGPVEFLLGLGTVRVTRGDVTIPSSTDFVRYLHASGCFPSGYDLFIINGASGGAYKVSESENRVNRKRECDVSGPLSRSRGRPAPGRSRRLGTRHASSVNRGVLTSSTE